MWLVGLSKLKNRNYIYMCENRKEVSAELHISKVGKEVLLVHDDI